MEKSEISNKAAMDAAGVLITDTIGKGLDVVDLIVTLETTIVSVVLGAAKRGCEKSVLETVIEGSRARLAEILLKTAN